MFRRLGVADDPGRVQPNLQTCLEAVLEQSPVLMDDVLLGLGALLKPAQLELLMEHQQALRQRFAEHLRIFVFGAPVDQPAPEALMRFDDFQFLDAEQIDANIEWAQCQHAVQLAVDDVLPALNAMVSSLLGWSSVQAHLNPLKPESFVRALQTTLADFVPEPAQRAPILGQASGLLGVNLRHLYREVTAWLRSLGVEPVHMAPSASSSLWNPAKAADSTVARTLLTLDKLRRLLSGELDANGPADGQLDFSHTIPVSFEALQDMKLVEPMMKRLAARAANAPAAAPPAAVDMLAAEAEPAQRRKLGAQLGREVVLLMFDNLMQDRRLLAPVRASLQRLQPVLLALARTDGRFFSEHQHPARLFLDRMTHRSLAFADEAAPGYGRFQKSFDNAVSVLCGGAGDTASFARMVRKLDETWAAEEAEQHRRAAEAARSLLHAEQRNLLAQRLAVQFARRLEGLKVPEMVGNFLRGPWSQVVAQAQIGLADGSVDPGGYQSLVDDLIWSVQLKLARRNRSRLVQLVPGMLVTMRRGLELIAYPPERMAAFFDALIAFHEKAFDSARAALNEAAAPPPAEVAPEEGFWMADSEAADSGYLDDASLEQDQESRPAPVSAVGDQTTWSLDELATGSWVNLALGGSWLRAQLTWASPQRTLFMFVSGSGLAHSMSRKTLERLKRSRLIRLVSDGRVVDNALDAVARTALHNDLQLPPPKRGK